MLCKRFSDSLQPQGPVLVSVCLSPEHFPFLNKPSLVLSLITCLWCSSLSWDIRTWTSFLAYSRLWSVTEQRKEGQETRNGQKQCFQISSNHFLIVLEVRVGSGSHWATLEAWGWFLLDTGESPCRCHFWPWKSLAISVSGPFSHFTSVCKAADL